MKYSTCARGLLAGRSRQESSAAKLVVPASNFQPDPSHAGRWASPCPCLSGGGVTPVGSSTLQKKSFGWVGRVGLCWLGWVVFVGVVGWLLAGLCWARPGLNRTGVWYRPGSAPNRIPASICWTSFGQCCRLNGGMFNINMVYSRFWRARRFGVCPFS